MRDESSTGRRDGPDSGSWEDDRVGAGMQRWRREFPEIDCSGKAVVGRLLHLHEVFLTAIDRALAQAPAEISDLRGARDAAGRGRALPHVAQGAARLR